MGKVRGREVDLEFNQRPATEKKKKVFFIWLLPSFDPNWSKRVRTNASVEPSLLIEALILILGDILQGDEN
ncbi:hypothetical protein H6P81_010990 [Aristolochia fimbriata]|uniref:Uncharacterized protein n=1 Tax=Aristolochia fimbriata TaxID=158543 RepID=A0AAV7EQB2_ARIFI|nr:hypothetical protein H6P81_010990 [Aristolochia fimbriata]